MPILTMRRPILLILLTRIRILLNLLNFRPIVLMRPRRTRLSRRLPLLGRLRHRVQDAKIMFGILEIALRHHPVAAAGSIAAKLQVFLEKLLRRATNAQIGTHAVEHMIAVQRNLTALLADLTATAAASTTAATASATTAPVVASAHTFHIHASAIALS
jgi:hypothetical protein